MRASPGRDRLAAWTDEEAGEEVPAGDASVTAERAAADRETLAKRFAAVLPKQPEPRHLAVRGGLAARRARHRTRPATTRPG